MTRRTRIRFPKVKGLTEQQTDFTFEGAPPPGRVGNAVPVTSEKGPPLVPHMPPAVPTAGHRPHSDKSR